MAPTIQQSDLPDFILQAVFYVCGGYVLFGLYQVLIKYRLALL